MPKRKKSDLSQYSIPARRQKVARNAETDAEKEERRAADADRHKASRSAERLTADRPRRRRRSTALARAAFSYTSDQHYVADHALSIGSMFVECQHCRAKKFNGETPGMCCAKGKVVLPPLAAAPEPLATLLESVGNLYTRFPVTFDFWTQHLCALTPR